MSQLVFNRYEKKYLMPAAVCDEFRERLMDHMAVDQYGLSTICNIYYDTPDDLLIRRSIEHPRYKEKLRLRSYGVPGRNTAVFLEIKKKYRRIVNKRRIELPLECACDYLNLGIRPDCEGQILNEIDFFLQRYPLQPRLYLAYDRVALFGKEDPDFRITFDSKIRSRRTDLALECGDFGDLLLPESWYLMESKIQDAAPKWFSDLLTEFRIYSTSFSKYGSIYKKEHGCWNAEDLMRHRLENWTRRARIEAVSNDQEYKKEYRKEYDQEYRRKSAC